MGLDISGIGSAINGISGMVKTGIDKFFPDKASEVDKLKFTTDMQQFVMDNALKEDGQLRDFIIAYEGAAKDIPKGLVWLRSSVRPVLTYLISGTFVWGFIHPGTFTPAQMDLLSPAMIMTLTFWYGEKIIQNTGLNDRILGKHIKKEQ